MSFHSTKKFEPTILGTNQESEARKSLMSFYLSRFLRLEPKSVPTDGVLHLSDTKRIRAGHGYAEIRGTCPIILTRPGIILVPDSIPRLGMELQNHLFL